MTGGLSFRGFVEELSAQADKSESTEAPVLEEASDGVRLMTVHSAKGLEFPVVILADMTANLAAREAERFVDGRLCAIRLTGAAPQALLHNERHEHDRELSEGVRVAYVAATRARDLLVIPAVGDEECEGWLAPLNKAIYPAREQRRANVAAKGCPTFAGDRTVMERPFDYQQPEDSVRPGLHVPQTGDHRVVWWDPTALRLDVASAFGLRREDILSAEPAANAEEGIARYRQWRADRRQIIEAGSVPAFRIVSPAGGSADPPELHPIYIESVSATSRRGGGRRFGILVHAILRDLDLRGTPAQITALAKVHGRLIDAPLEEAEAAVAAVAATWAHPLLERARAAARGYRELPIDLRLEDGRVLEGVIDLAFREEDRWVVVDFKTDSRAWERYEKQLQWYVYALTRLTGSQATGYLLQI